MRLARSIRDGRMDRHDLSGAEEAAEIIAAFSPNDIENHRKLGWLFSKEACWEDAYEEFSTVIVNNPATMEEDQLNLAEASEMTSRFKESKAICEKYWKVTRIILER